MKAVAWLCMITLGTGAFLIFRHSQPAAPPLAITQTAPRPSVVAEGRIAAYPGREVVVASEKAGIIDHVHFHELDTVRKGQVLAELRNSDLRAALEEALAHVREAEADIQLADAENGRTDDLVKRQFLGRQALDRTQRDLSAAQARLESGEATVKRIRAQIEKTRIVAPISGTVIIRHVNDGEAVSDGGAVATLANLKRLRVEAEVDEFDIGRVKPGDSVSVTAEGYEGKSWRGTVEELPDAVKERGLRPQDVARPTDARVLLVKIALQEAVPLKLGQRVEVAIAPHDTTQPASTPAKLEKF